MDMETGNGNRSMVSIPCQQDDAPCFPSSTGGPEVRLVIVIDCQEGAAADGSVDAALRGVGEE